MNLPVRLSKIGEMTGVPESTLRQAILDGNLRRKAHDHGGAVNKTPLGCLPGLILWDWWMGLWKK